MCGAGDPRSGSAPLGLYNLNNWRRFEGGNRSITRQPSGSKGEKPSDFAKTVGAAHVNGRSKQAKPPDVRLRQYEILKEVLVEHGVPAPALTATRLLRDNGIKEAAEWLHYTLAMCLEEARARLAVEMDRQEVWDGVAESYQKSVDALVTGGSAVESVPGVLEVTAARAEGNPCLTHVNGVATAWPRFRSTHQSEGTDSTSRRGWLSSGNTATASASDRLSTAVTPKNRTHVRRDAILNSPEVDLTERDCSINVEGLTDDDTVRKAPLGLIQDRQRTSHNIDYV